MGVGFAMETNRRGKKALGVAIVVAAGVVVVVVRIVVVKRTRSVQVVATGVTETVSCVVYVTRHMLVVVSKLYHVGAPAVPVGNGVKPKRVVQRVAMYVVAFVPCAKTVGMAVKRAVRMMEASIVTGRTSVEGAQ
jgi:hypothetical protein